MKTKDITVYALLIGLYIVLEYIQKYLPSMPQGGTLSLSAVILLASSYLLGIKKTLFISSVAVILHFFLIEISFLSIPQFLFDYFFATICLSLASIFKNKYFGITFAILLRYLSYTLAGVVFWYMYAPSGMNVILYSLRYNIFIVGPTLILTLLVTPTIIRAISKAKII